MSDSVDRRPDSGHETSNVSNLGRMKTFDKMTALLLTANGEWYHDPAASGSRHRRWPSWSRDELIAYEDGRWEVHVASAGDQPSATGKEPTLDNAKERAILVYVAMLLPCEGLINV